MFQVDSFKRPSPSPSRSSIRSETKSCRQPRVIQVNRDVATMVESERQASDEARVPDWEPFSAPATTHFRSRTFSDGFLPNNSQELLLAVDCDACLALQSQRHCHNEHISQHDFDLVCNCNLRQYNYLNYQPDIADQRENNFNTFNVDKFKRHPDRPISSHHSLDRKHTKRKAIGVSNYISKQLISYDPANNFMQKIKRNLSNLKKIGGDAISKRSQNAVQLADLHTDSSSSLKKLSMMSLMDKTHQRARKSQSYIFTSSDFQNKNDSKNNIPSYSNVSGSIDQCTDRSKPCNFTMDRRAPQAFKMRGFDNNDDFVGRNSAKCQRKFSTLDNRSRCRSIPRQMSYNDFASDGVGKWSHDQDTEIRMDSRRTLEESESQTCLEPELVMLEASPRAARCHCTCEQSHDKKFSSVFYDYQGGKRTPPAPDVTRRGPAVGPARSQPCRACKATPWSSTGTTSSHSSTTTGTSSRFTVAHRRWCCVAVLVLVAGTACVAGPLALRAPPGAPLHERLRLAERLLHETPLIDGHNDLPWNIRKFVHNKIKDFKFDEDLRTISPWATSPWSHTDLPRLKQGRISAQFWAAYVPCDSQHRDAVQLTFEQIDLIQRLTEKYHPQLTLCTSASDIVAAHTNHRICSLIGVEGGHAIGGSLGVLRTLYQVGVRYLTLTSTCDTPWAECSLAPEQPDGWTHEGLSAFGKVVVKEMNRLGMLVDLSHVSVRTMRDALAVSRAPVLFSHSSARALCNATRNVPDVVLRLLAANKGLVMVNFYASFLTCKNTATVHDAIAHINHIRDVAGVDSVGLGAGFDGINYTPQGLEDVSSYPLLFAELMEAGWTMEELRKLAGLNLLRVLGAAERVSRDLAAANVIAYEEVPPRPPDPHNCSSQDL